MRISLISTFILFLFTGILIFSCNKKADIIDEDFKKERLTELMIPLKKENISLTASIPLSLQILAETLKYTAILSNTSLIPPLQITLEDPVIAFLPISQIALAQNRGSQMVVIPLLLLTIM